VAELAQRLEREELRNGDLLGRLKSVEQAVQQAEQHLATSADPATHSGATAGGGSAISCSQSVAGGASTSQDAQQDTHAAARQVAALAPPLLRGMSGADTEAQRFVENLQFVHSMGLVCPHQMALLMATAPQWPPPGSMAERGLQASCPRCWLRLHPGVVHASPLPLNVQ
jgi:hypothetical protein